MDYRQTEEDKLDIITKVRNDPWEFSKYVFTKDEQDTVNPCKRFPYDLAYIKVVFKLLQMQDRIVAPKSRRMKMTWTCTVYILWDAMFHEGRHEAVVSKKEDDADFILQKRIKYMYDNLDPKLPRELLPKMKTKYGKLEFPEIDSIIQGFPQGEDQLRMYTLNNIFADEFAFWEKAVGTYAAAAPTLEGGGSFIGISSPAPGFFKDLCLDESEKGDDDRTIAKQDLEVKQPMQGVKFWKNPVNQFLVLQLHYTADPAKRSPEFKASIKKGIPHKKYMQEYELVWQSYAGEAVYPDFSITVHGSKVKIDPWMGLPLLRGWDFGLTPACVVGQLQEDTLVILKEYQAVNMGIERFCEIIMPDMRVRFPQWNNQEDWLDVIDPAGFAKKDTDEKTCAGIMRNFGIKPKPGPMVWEVRRSSVEHYLTTQRGGSPCFKIAESECPYLVDGFQGGYHYPEDGVNKSASKIKPEKNIYSHSHDALQMLTAKIKEITRKHKKLKKIPRLGYSFNKR